MDEEQDVGLRVPPEAEWGPTFDVARATDAYIATVPAADREKSDAYFEGGYWIAAWSALIVVLICWLLLRLRFAARIRDWAAARGRGPFLQSFVVAVGFLLALFVLTLPWSLYTGYFREHQYGMSNHTLAGYLGEAAINLAITTAFIGFAIAGLYRLIARVRERWVWWAMGATAIFILFVIMVTPVFVAPLFNDYKPLPEGETRESILALARATEVPADDVYWFDASRQTKRISANVSGLWGTTRISLNDNLMNGTSLPEIRAVMGHEMGHYRLHHGLWLTLVFTILLGIALLGHQPQLRPLPATPRRALGRPRPCRSGRTAACVCDLHDRALRPDAIHEHGEPHRGGAGGCVLDWMPQGSRTASQVSR